MGGYACVASCQAQNCATGYCVRDHCRDLSNHNTYPEPATVGVQKLWFQVEARYKAGRLAGADGAI